MKTQKSILFLFIVLLAILSQQPLFAQIQTQCYKVSSGESKSIIIENRQLYRITIKSSWYSADACIGTYLIYGLNVSDPKTQERPSVLVVAETPQIDWRFNFRISGQFDADMKITSQGWGDQGLLIIVERLSCY